MTSRNKSTLFIFLSLLCGIGVAGLYPPFSHWSNPTRLWFFEFPPLSWSVLIKMAGILFVGMFFGTIARKLSTQIPSKFQIGFATFSIFFNAVILVLPLLNLIAVFTPRTITAVVDYKIGTENRGYICVTEIKTGNSWSQEVDFGNNLVVYLQNQKVDQNKDIVSIDTIQPGQVVEIGYIDNDTSRFIIKARSITILEGQHRSYKNDNCGSMLP